MGDLLNSDPTLNEQVGTLSGDTPLSDGGSLGALTFDNAGPTSIGTGNLPTDPMQKLHMPTLQQNTTTTVQTQGGGNPGQPGLPSGTATVAPTGGASPNGLVGFAKKFIGVPYVWGGTSPNGFDCSGFVQYVYKHFGVNLPRLSSDQARSGQRISFKDLRAGDLVAIDNSSRNNGADHIGIYIGNGMVMDAPRPGRSVEIAPLSVFDGGWGVRINFPGHHSAISSTINKPHVYHA